MKIYRGKNISTQKNCPLKVYIFPTILIDIIGIRHLYRHPCQCLKRKEDYVLRSLNVFTVSSETTIND